jgi:hypothetical protein
MVTSDDSPKGLARRLAARKAHEGRKATLGRSDELWRRETFRLPRTLAREKARSLFAMFPKAAYMTEIEWWREWENDEIEFTIRRRHSAD